MLFGIYYIQSHINGKVVAVQGKSARGAGGGGGSRGIGKFFLQFGTTDKSVVKTLLPRKAPPVRGTHKDTL
jgi:hypothetical protein